MRRRFVKATNIAALVSMLASLFTFAPMLPVHAAPPDVALEELSTTLAQPIFSANWDTDPTYTNVTYTYMPSVAVHAVNGDACQGTNNCAVITVDLQDDQVPTSTHQSQEWMATVVTGDITWNGPANSSVFSVTRDDVDGNGVYESLALSIDCSATCVFATSTEYSFTIVNYPIKNPETFVNPPPGFQYMTRSHAFTLADNTAGDQADNVLTSIVAIGDALAVSASVDPSLSFSIEGVSANGSFLTDTVDIDTTATPDSCDFGTLTPTVPKVCAWFLNIATNAANGYSIYVVQDQNMTFNGNEIKQFRSGTRVDDAAAEVWGADPTAASLAHLGYSSDDTSVFPPSSGNAVWAGIPNIAGAGAAPVITGLVADSISPGDDQYGYALKIESASTLPQGTGYTHNEYFIVVGNF